METEILDNATHWLTTDQTLLIGSGVNIAAALLTLVIRWLAANLLTGGMVAADEGPASRLHHHRLHR